MVRRKYRLHGGGLSKAFSTAIAAAYLMLLTGCSSMVAGVAVKAPMPANSDGAVVALMDTGNYPTTARPPYGTAGSTTSGLILESNRMAEYVVGPWQVDARLRFRDPWRTAPMDSTRYVALYLGFLDHDRGGQNLDDIAAAHGYITGFSSARNPQEFPLSDYVVGGWQGLTNEVLRFPDPESAAAAAREMATAENPPPIDYSTGHPVSIDNHAEAAATAFTGNTGDSVVVASFAAHGPYVLYQQARISKAEDPFNPENGARDLVSTTLDDQERAIDRFIPTDPAKLADLPEDPSGWLAARTVFPLDSRDSPAGEGVWQPNSWLHFSDDPIDTATLFRDAGVDTVSQGLTTVFRARDATGAARVVDRFEANTRGSTDINPISGVTGLPAARCFERTNGFAPPADPLPLQQAWWHYMCVAQADRYAYTAFSAQESDVKQQIAAQYRILAGK